MWVQLSLTMLEPLAILYKVQKAVLNTYLLNITDILVVL